jgi:hypothetical protein
VIRVLLLLCALLAMSGCNRGGAFAGEWIGAYDLSGAAMGDPMEGLTRQIAEHTEEGPILRLGKNGRFRLSFLGRHEGSWSGEKGAVSLRPETVSALGARLPPMTLQAVGGDLVLEEGAGVKVVFRRHK